MTTDTISPATDPAAFVSDWEDWHATHETQRAAADGFLAITGLHFLTTEPARFGDAPGAWSVDEVGPVVELSADEQLSLDGVELTGRHAFGAIAERDGVNARAGDAVIEIARRGGELIVHPRHPDTVREGRCPQRSFPEPSGSSRRPRSCRAGAGSRCASSMT